MSDAGVSQNRGRKFDLQLGQALIDERRLGEIFACDKIVRSGWRVELKSEVLVVGANRQHLRRVSPEWRALGRRGH